MNRQHWENCITHFESDSSDFIDHYFDAKHRKCLVIAGAGFDPRSSIISTTLANKLGARLSAVFFREERGEASSALRDAADDNEKSLRARITNIEVEEIDIFADDGAAVGGVRVRDKFKEFNGNGNWLEEFTDVILDMSALSIGVSFPAAKILLQMCEGMPAINFHIMMASNPALDKCITSEPDDRVKTMPGFAPLRQDSPETPVAKIWLPQLAKGKKSVLESVERENANLYRICPILPFPARDPREADNLIGEYCDTLYDGWNVDARDLMYVSERNPLDSYRTIGELKTRYDHATKDIYVPDMILSPLGSKVMAAGALMAAIEFDLTVQYVETLRYDYDHAKHKASHVDEAESEIVHVWLHGPIYEGYGNGNDK